MSLTARRNARPRPVLPAPDGRPRVGVLTPGLLLGGAERWILALAAALPEYQWAIGLLHPANQYPPLAREATALCPVVTGRRSIAQLSEWCDVAMSWGIPDSHALLSPAARCRTILVSHGVGEWTVKAMRDAAAWDVLVAVAEIARQTFPEDQRSRVQVLHNGVDPARVVPTVPRAELRRRWGVPEAARLVGYLGRFSQEKYPEGLRRAVEALPPSWWGVGIGNGALVESCRGERIALPGPTADVGSALAAVDWVVLLSDEEACSLALAEAWLARVPVVATNTGMVPELPWAVRQVPFRATGAQLADALRADAADAAGTRERVEWAYRYAAEHLTLGAFAGRWRGLLGSLLERQSI